MAFPAQPAAPSPKHFIHQPLDLSRPSIRLLRILPNLSPDGLVQCKLSLMPPRERRYKYTCLSYVWGNEKDHGGPFQILVNSQSYFVHYNLHEFLKAAKLKYSSRMRWWIDALCIDQNNNEEKNHQVGQMSKIYRHANEVIAWLGADPRVGRALEIINYSFRAQRVRHIYYDTTTMVKLVLVVPVAVPAAFTVLVASSSSRFIPRCMDLVARLLETRAKSASFCKKTAVDAVRKVSAARKGKAAASPPLPFLREEMIYAHDQDCIKKLYSEIDRYWSRAWIMPEVMLSRRLKLFSHTTDVDMARFCTPTLEFLEHHTTADLVTAKSVGDIFETRGSARHANTDQIWNLYSLIVNSGSKKCSIPRDRIYSIIPLCPEGAYLDADYKISDIEVMRRTLELLPKPICPHKVLGVAVALKIIRKRPSRKLTTRAGIKANAGHVSPCVIEMEIPLDRFQYGSPLGSYFPFHCSKCHSDHEGIQNPGWVLCLTTDSSKYLVHVFWEQQTPNHGANRNKGAHMNGDVRVAYRTSGVRTHRNFECSPERISAYFDVAHSTIQLSLSLLSIIMNATSYSPCTFCHDGQKIGCGARVLGENEGHQGILEREEDTQPMFRDIDRVASL